MYYIFIDESGKFPTKDQHSHFVIGSFAVADNKDTYNKISAWFKNKFKNHKKEVKWSDTYISDKLRLKTLKYIKGLDIDIKFVYINNIDLKYFKKGKLESGILYVDLIIQVLHMYDLKNKESIHIQCDQRSLKNVKTQDFIRLVKNGILQSCSPKIIIQVQMVRSEQNPNIQIADWIAGAMFRFLEKGHLWKEIGTIFDL